jgi:hypothetical protein
MPQGQLAGQFDQVVDCRYIVATENPASSLAAERRGDDVGVWGEGPDGKARRPNRINVGTGGIFNAGPQTMGSPTIIDGPAGTVRSLIFDTSGKSRWALRENATPEGGADAGSDFELAAFTDAGVQIDIPLTIVRAAGGTIRIATGRPLVFGGLDNVTGAYFLLAPKAAVGAVGVQGGTFDVFGFNGSIAVPTATVINDALGIIRHCGFDGANVRPGAHSQGVATENWTAVARGSALVWSTTPNGAASPVERWWIRNVGHLQPDIDNILDIGAAGATRPRRIYCATALQIEADGAAGLTTGLCLTNQTVGAGGLATKSFPVNVNGALFNVLCN